MDIIEKEPQQENEYQHLSNRSKNKMILLIFVLVIIVAVVILTMYTKKKRVQDKIDNLQVEALDSLTEKEVDILSELSKLEVLKNKQDDCDSKSGEEKEECLEMLKSLQVTFLEDEELCEQLDSQKDQCFKNLAINKKDINICQRVEDESLQQFCTNFIYQHQAQIDGNLELCDKIKEDLQKEICIESVFEYVGSVEMCDSEYVINNDLVDKCESITLFKKAILRNDPNVCDQIPLERYRMDCFQSM